jgi:ketosteroid isomerase-like protein
MKRTIYATPQDAEAAFYESIERSDLEAMMTVWADDDDIVCVHPGAARASGVAQVRESWRQIFAGGQALRFRLRQPQTVNGMTLVVHSVYEQISIAGEARTHGPVVATNVYAHRKRLAHGVHRVRRALQPRCRKQARAKDAALNLCRRYNFRVFKRRVMSGIDFAVPISL